MRRFAIVCGQEFKETLRSKPFITISIFLAVILVVGAIAGFILTMGINDADSGVVDYTGEYADDYADAAPDYIVAFDDRTGENYIEKLSAVMPDVRFDAVELDEAAAEEYLAQECDACVILHDPLSFEIYEPANMYSMGSYVGDNICFYLEQMAKHERFAELGVSASDAQEIMDTEAVYISHAVGGYDIGKYLYNITMVILMFLVIGLYGQMVATRVATEKSSRTMEVLSTSVTPAELLCGKVMGVGAAGLMQMVIFLLAAVGLIAGLLSSAPELAVIVGQLLDISVLDIVYLCCYFIFGFLLTAFIYGGLGSMVSQVEDLSGVANLPMYLLMAGYFIAIFSTSSGYVTGIMRVASYVPFWSPIVMFSRMSMEYVAPWEVAISLALLVGTCVLTAWASARLYRTGMLRYGKPPKLKEIFAAIK